MVAICIDTRRHAADVYGSADGRQWVLREDYEALMRKATLTEHECKAMYYVGAIAHQLADSPNFLNDAERSQIVQHLAAFREVCARLFE